MRGMGSSNDGGVSWFHAISEGKLPSTRQAVSDGEDRIFSSSTNIATFILCVNDDLRADSFAMNQP